MVSSAVVENIVLEKAPRRSSPDPIACAKKYFIAASFSRFIEELVMRGIKDRRFSSRPIQI